MRCCESKRLSPYRVDFAYKPSCPLKICPDLNVSPRGGFAGDGTKNSMRRKIATVAAATIARLPLADAISDTKTDHKDDRKGKRQFHGR